MPDECASSTRFISACRLSSARGSRGPCRSSKLCPPRSARAPHVVVDLVAGASSPSGRTSDIRAHPPRAPAAFDSMAFIADGPLALFGPPAQLRLPLLRSWRQIANIARKADLQPPLILGIEKSGEFVDHANDPGDLIERGAPPAAAHQLHPGVRQRPPRRLWGRHILRPQVHYRTTDERLIVFSTPPLAGKAALNEEGGPYWKAATIWS